MSLTPSTMLTLGTRAPHFQLPDVVSDKTVGLADFSDASALLVMFICNHCPYVVHVRDELSALGRDYSSRGLGVVAISSNDVESYPSDSPAHMKRIAAEWSLGFPYLYDESQAVAQAYKAACTPDFYLFDADQTLCYRGQLDNARPGNDRPIDGKDLRSAIEAVLMGEAVSEAQRPSLGCNIKWKPGIEPSLA